MGIQTFNTVAMVVDIYASQSFSPLAWGVMRGQRLPVSLSIFLPAVIKKQNNSGSTSQSPTPITSVSLRSDRWKLTSNLMEAWLNLHTCRAEIPVGKCKRRVKENSL